MNAVRNWLIRYRVALIVGLVVLLAIISFRIVNGLTEYRLVVPLDSADGLYPGSDVLIAGAKAGSVQDITLDGNQTLVTVALDDAYAPVHSDARVTVRPKSLLGEKYVALDPGSAGLLSSGARLPQTQVARAVELQDVVNSLDAPTREKLRTLVISLGGGLAGEGLAISRTLATNTDLVVADPTTFDRGMKSSTSVFGAQDGQGFATRINVVVGPCSAAPCNPPFFGAGPGGVPVPDSFDAVVGLLLGGKK